MKFCGIDNGLKGGIVFAEDNKIVFYDMPTIKNNNKTFYDVQAIKTIFLKEKPDFVCLEKAQAFPGQGVRSMFTTGYGFGLIEGMIAILNISYYIVQPRIWQRDFFQGHSGDPKSIGYMVATKLFPKYANQLITKRKKIKDGLVDALLICKFGENYFKNINREKKYDR